MWINRCSGTCPGVCFLPSARCSRCATCLAAALLHAAMIPDKTSTRRVRWPRGTGPKIPANQACCSSVRSVRSANQKKAAGCRAAPVTNAVIWPTPMETATGNKTCSWIWKADTCVECILVQNASDSLPETFQQEKCHFVAAPEMQQGGPSVQVASCLACVCLWVT